MAIPDCIKAIELDPKLAMAYHPGEAYEKVGKKKEAEAEADFAKAKMLKGN